MEGRNRDPGFHFQWWGHRVVKSRVRGKKETERETRVEGDEGSNDHRGISERKSNIGKGKGKDITIS